MLEDTVSRDAPRQSRQSFGVPFPAARKPCPRVADNATTTTTHVLKHIERYYIHTTMCTPLYILFSYVSNNYCCLCSLVVNRDKVLICFDKFYYKAGYETPKKMTTKKKVTRFFFSRHFFRALF
jgi:hypothetical protein